MIGGLGAIVGYFTGRQADKNFWRQQQLEFKRMAKQANCLHTQIVLVKDPGDIEHHMRCLNCQRSFVTQASLDAARREAEGAETGATPQTGNTATGARATGWKIRTGCDHNAVDGLVSGLAGYYYAEGPGDLRIRTNDRALLDRILLLLEDEAAIIERLSEDPRLMERVATKAGVDLGGNKLPNPIIPDEPMRNAADRQPGELCAEEVRNADHKIREVTKGADFDAWLDRAYNHDGSDGRIFTRYNMEVAFKAGIAWVMGRRE